MRCDRVVIEIDLSLRTRLDEELAGDIAQRAITTLSAYYARLVGPVQHTAQRRRNCSRLDLRAWAAVSPFSLAGIINLTRLSRNAMTVS